MSRASDFGHKFTHACADAAREAARRLDGRFGKQHSKSEADVEAMNLIGTSTGDAAGERTWGDTGVPAHLAETWEQNGSTPDGVAAAFGRLGMNPFTASFEDKRSDTEQYADLIRDNAVWAAGHKNTDMMLKVASDPDAPWDAVMVAYSSNYVPSRLSRRGSEKYLTARKIATAVAANPNTKQKTQRQVLQDWNEPDRPGDEAGHEWSTEAQDCRNPHHLVAATSNDNATMLWLAHNSKSFQALDALSKREAKGHISPEIAKVARARMHDDVKGPKHTGRSGNDDEPTVGGMSLRQHGAIF